jgi:hypothetical protein
MFNFAHNCTYVEYDTFKPIDSADIIAEMGDQLSQMVGAFITRYNKTISKADSQQHEFKLKIRFGSLERANIIHTMTETARQIEKADSVAHYNTLSCKCSECDIIDAIFFNLFNLFKLYTVKGRKFDAIYRVIVQYGRVKMFDHLISLGFFPKKKAIDKLYQIAADYGQLTIMTAIEARYGHGKINYTAVFERTACKGRMPVVAHVINHVEFRQLETSTLFGIAFNGNVEIATLIVQTLGYNPHDYSALMNAVVYENTEMVKFIMTLPKFDAAHFISSSRFVDFVERSNPQIFSIILITIVPIDLINIVQDFGSQSVAKLDMIYNYALLYGPSSSIDKIAEIAASYAPSHGLAIQLDNIREQRRTFATNLAHSRANMRFNFK